MCEHVLQLHLRFSSTILHIGAVTRIQTWVFVVTGVGLTEDIPAWTEQQ